MQRFSYSLKHGVLISAGFLFVFLLSACSSPVPTTKLPPTKTIPPIVIPKVTLTPVIPPTVIPTIAVPATTPIVIPTVTGKNILANGTAEQGNCATTTSAVVRPIPGWTPKGDVTAIQYSAPGGDLDAEHQIPADHGACYFWGGPAKDGDNTTVSMSQKVDISAWSAQTVTGKLAYQLSAWEGGYANQGDNAVLSVQFLDPQGHMVGTAALPAVTAKDRNNNSELIQRSKSSVIPSTTISVLVTVTFTKTDASDNDGLIDDISLILA